MWNPHCGYDIRDTVSDIKMAQLVTLTKITKKKKKKSKISLP